MEPADPMSVEFDPETMESSNARTARIRTGSTKLYGDDRCHQTCFNATTVIMWLLFTAFNLSQPWLSDWANNSYAGYTRNFTRIETKNDTLVLTKRESYGLCTVPPSDMFCTDGQNFTELVLKFRPQHPFGCGCGEGILGEGLCSRTSYGHTLSDYVSTAPAIGALVGFAIYPIIGLRHLMVELLEKYDPALRIARLLWVSQGSFLVSFVFWSISSVCVFPVAHAVLTCAFLGSFIVFALTLLYIIYQHDQKLLIEEKVIVAGAVTSFVAIVLGAVPRILMSVNKTFDMAIFPTTNNGGILSYVFWLGEAIGLSIFFGLYPLVLLANLAAGEAGFDAHARELFGSDSLEEDDEEQSLAWQNFDDDEEEGEANE